MDNIWLEVVNRFYYIIVFIFILKIMYIFVWALVEYDTNFNGSCKNKMSLYLFYVGCTFPVEILLYVFKPLIQSFFK